MELNITPNTGHHFFFIPITVDSTNMSQLAVAIEYMEMTNPDDERIQWLRLGENNEALKNELYHLGTGDTFPWMEYSAEDGRGLEWVRYRLGRQERSNKTLPALLGVWLAIESNIGDVNRGLEEENIQPMPTEQDAIDDIQNPKTPYAFSRQNYDNFPCGQIIRQNFKEDFKEILKRIVKRNHEEEIELCFGDIPSLDIIWLPILGKDLDVDLFIDFGNTRTAVISMSTNATAVTSNHDLFQTMTFVNENETRWDKDIEAEGLVDSFFVLQEPMFHGMHKTLMEYNIEERDVVTHHIIPPFTRHHTERKLTNIKKIHPQMFVQEALVAIGYETRELLSIPANIQDIARGGSYIQSSPKHYYWDTDEVIAWWNMFPRKWNQNREKFFHPLQGDLLSFCPMNGCDWSSDNPPVKWSPECCPTSNPIQANYPRSVTMTWMAYSILEAAYRQLNSPDFNRGFYPYIKKNIHGIYLTYPSGWTKEEIDSFRAKWETARNIFYLTHQEKSVEQPSVPSERIKPVVEMEVDEAVAAQLPYIYSEIKKLEKINCSKSSVLWMKMIGSKPTDDGSPKARIMTLDIGGGKSDMSIIEYQERNPDIFAPGKLIDASLLFKDSKAPAGDLLVKKIIEKILLPALTQCQDRSILYRWNSRCDISSINTKQLVIRQVLIPIVYFWMQCVSDGKDFRNNNGNCYSAEDIRISPNNYIALERIFNDGISEDERDINILRMDTPINITPGQFIQCVREVFSDNGFMKHIAQIVSSFQVNALVVCGKVSELPFVKDLIYRFMPLAGSRIIFMKDYPIGNWYPSIFSKDGRIKDSKTVTVSGAALYHAISHGMIADWHLRYDNSHFIQKNNWKIAGAEKPFFTRDSEDNSITLNYIISGTVICRNAFEEDFDFEPVYELRIRNPEWRENGSQWRTHNGYGVLRSLTLSRWMDEGREKLKIESAEGEYTDARGNKNFITHEDVELYLHPMVDEENWQDSTRLG